MKYFIGCTRCPILACKGNGKLEATEPVTVFDCGPCSVYGDIDRDRL